MIYEFLKFLVSGIFFSEINGVQKYHIYPYTIINVNKIA